MKLNTVLIIAAVVAFIFGLWFILAPVSAMNTYGTTLSEVGAQFLGRYFGAALLGYAFIAFLNRNAASMGVRAGLFAAMVLGFAVSLWDKFAGGGNALVWLNVVIYLLLALGFGYFTFMKKD
jgi:hypothetical protein